jgi:hypothetical protein
MNAWLRRLLEPAETSPTDPFRWSDKRPIRKQVASGFRIAGGLLAGFVVMMAVLFGLGRLSQDPGAHSSSSYVFGTWVALGVAAIIMFWTANRWAPFVTGFFFGPALLKILGALFLEPDSYFSSHAISRSGLTELFAYSLAAVLLTSRFVGKRPAQTTVVDRFALTLFVFTSFGSIGVPRRFALWLLLSGVLALLAAWCFHRFTRKNLNRARHDRRPHSSRMADFPVK